ncbi:uncharacterized protein LOC121864878 isoform X1 [Homarus americanus]|uniref:uncharacterized protein LOC121864878 isoform X1 n=2 Tax=Homarus americanus TaxID=6706 RepID=UPI001C4471F4|nr:uncharacterized protein LOC121864878 isoform X1 [Homarus americanus]
MCGEDVCGEQGCWYVEQLLGEASSRPADCGSPVKPPLWYDKAKLKRGQSVFHHYFLSVFVSNLVGLLCLLSVHSILKVLTFTGRSSTPVASYKRYLGTLNHVRRWYSGDVFDPQSSAFKSIQLVRRMHTSSFSDSQTAGVLLASQTDMVVTQWAFFGLALTHGQQLGLRCTRNEEESLVHFWRCIGYLLGIEDRYNLASGELEEVRAKCNAVAEKVIAEGLINPPDHFGAMAESMLQGVHMIVPVVDPAATIAFTHHLLALGHDTQKLSWYSTIFLYLNIWNLGVVRHIPIIGEVLRLIENGLLNFALIVCNSLPTIALYYRYLETTVYHVLMTIIAIPKTALHSFTFFMNRKKIV